MRGSVLSMVFLSNLIYNFFIALGVMIGACTFAGVAALINGSPPMKTMIDLAYSIRIWAVAIALGGTFSTLEVIQDGIFKGDLKIMIKQIFFILSALIGANTGYSILKLVHKCGELLKL